MKGKSARSEVNDEEEEKEGFVVNERVWWGLKWKNGILDLKSCAVLCWFDGDVLICGAWLISASSYSLGMGAL